EKQIAPARDPRLDAVAAELASVLPEGTSPPHDLTAFLAEYFGIVEADITTIVSTGRSASDIIAALGPAIRPEMASGKFHRIGGGSAPIDNGVRVVVALQEAGVLSVDPFGREVRPYGTVTLRGRVAAPYTGTKVYVARPRGDVDTPAVSAGADGAFTVEVACGKDLGRLKVEIVADHPTAGPEV